MAFADLDQTLVELQAILDAVEDGTIAIIAGLTSHATTTGSITNIHLRAVLASTASTSSGAGSLNAASNACSATGIESAVISSDTCVASGTNSGVIASSVTCEASGVNSGVIASTDNCAADGNQSFIAACNDECTTPGTMASVLSSTLCDCESDRSFMASSWTSETDPANVFNMILVGRGVLNNEDYVLCGGYAAGGPPATANQKWNINSQTGVILHAGTITSSHTFTDLAEMIENGTGKEIPKGSLLTMIGDKVFPAREGDTIDGIVASTPGTLHGDTPFTWAGRWELDEFGKVKTAKGPDTAWTPKVEVKAVNPRGMVKGEPEFLIKEIDNPKPQPIIDIPIETAEYDPTIKNIKRSDRPDEWTQSAVVGILRTRTDATITQKAIDIATAARKRLYVTPSAVAGIGKITSTLTKVQVMRVIQEFDEEKGYGVTLTKLV